MDICRSCVKLGGEGRHRSDMWRVGDTRSWRERRVYSLRHH